MPYMHPLSDPGMNFTLNRPLMDGTSQARIAEIGAVASQITNYQRWHDVWLMLAKRAESEQRWLDAASYYHSAEFYLPAGDDRNGLYDDFARNWALGMQGVSGYQRIEVPYPGGTYPGFGFRPRTTSWAPSFFTVATTRSLRSSTHSCCPSPILASP